MKLLNSLYVFKAKELMLLKSLSFKFQYNQNLFIAFRRNDLLFF
jgi:hypothetical protein